MDKDSHSKWDNSKNRSSITTSENEIKIDVVQRDQFKTSLIREHGMMSQTLSSSSSTTAVINPLKNTSCCDSSMSVVNISSHSNEPQKSFSRRNTVQPLLKKPISNAPTTSIKPLILPAPASDAFSQHTKSNIVTVQNSHQSNSISTPFNCQQPMTMGIATIQPQHFGYQNISNNRYPMIPMSHQNNYSTQQLTFTNGGLGTTVQLMPVMNQNNNQMNNSTRVQSVPLFMAPIIGSHGGMLFQPNMTIMPQNSNPMQTFNIANTTYSHDFSHCQPMQTQTINPTNLRQSIVMPTETEFSHPKVDSEVVNINATATTTIVTAKETSVTNSSISASVVVTEPPLPMRPNIKQRDLIRTQIYRMKQLDDDDNNGKDRPDDSCLPSECSSKHDDHDEISSLNLEDEKNEQIDAKEIEKPDDNSSNLPLVPVSISPPLVAIENTSVTCPVISRCTENEKLPEPKVSQVPTLNKRSLPSPEILDNIQPIKIARISHEEEQPISGRKSPGSLFEKISQVIPERKMEILQNNKVNKLTAVVRPEQRKMLVHYLDDLVIFESDEPFPTTNKMQVVKSALRAGNIKLTPQKSKLLNDQYLFLSADEDLSPTKPKLKHNTKLSSSLKTTSFLEPLTIDIPTTTSSSCDSLDSSQVRPLSMCSYQSTLPASILSKKTSMDNFSPDKDMPKIDKEQSHSSIKSEIFKEKESTKVLDTEIVNSGDKIEDIVEKVKEHLPVKIISPVKQVKPVEKSALDRPICDWTVSDVADFVRQTPGCENYVAMFQNHEIDGEALLLLSKDNLIQGALNMKIGPALKLCARIDKRKALDPQ